MCVKPNIVYWAYIGLGALLLSNTRDTVYSVFDFIQMSKSDDHFSYFPVLPVLSVVIITVSIVAVIGLEKKRSWTRIVTSSIVGIQAFLMLGMLGMGIYTTSITPVLASPTSFFIIFSVVGVSLLLLSYKLYTSESFKIYLSKP